MKRLWDYIEGVKSNKIPTCIHVKNAVRRFENDLQRSDLVFREDKVKQVISFIASLKHFKGSHAGKNFILQSWQVFIIANIYGFYWKNGTRRFSNAYIEVARKNGKTALFLSALGLYHLIADGESSAEILLAANSKEQAHIGYGLTKGFAKGFDPEERYLRRYRNDINFDSTDSFLKVLAADSDKLDGFNCSMGIVDEYHSAPDSKVRDVIRSSMGMRDNPLLITITTAGFDKSLPCYELRTVCTEVIAGVKEEDSLFSIIYTLDTEDKWDDPSVWVKANPNLGITVKESFIKTEILKAKNNPSEEVGVKTKNLNIWCDSAQTWIPDEYILNATKKLNIKDFEGEDCYCGVDLASVQDMTAASYVIPKDGKVNLIVKYYLPTESLKTRTDKEQYKEWAMKGYLTLTPGNVTDYDYITKDMLEVSAKCNLITVAYDKWNSTQWAIDATGFGLPLEPFSQSIGNFNGPTRELEKAILSGEVVIDDNPITRFCFRNVEIKTDFNGNIKPNKGIAAKKIDGVIAAIQAMAMWSIRNANVYSGNIY